MRSLVLIALFFSTPLFSQTETVTNNNDSGAGSLRQAITDINAGSDASNTIHLQIPGNSPISVGSDLPVIKKNTTINSTGQQPINGQGQYRLFATIMADLSLSNCNLDQGAAIGGNVILSNFSSGGGGLGAGGGIYIDRGNTLILQTTTINQCRAQGGQGGIVSGINTNKGGGGLVFLLETEMSAILQVGESMLEEIFLDLPAQEVPVTDLLF